MSKYRITKDPKKMMTSKELYEAIENDYDNIKDFLPCRTSTYLEYTAGSTNALIWNEGETEKTKIYLPLQDGWYVTDEKYKIPNGEKSSSDNPKARYLARHQDRSFSGPVGLGYGIGYGGRRGFYAFIYWSLDSGVEKIENNTSKPLVSKTIKRDNTQKEVSRIVPTRLTKDKIIHGLRNDYVDIKNIKSALEFLIQVQEAVTCPEETEGFRVIIKKTFPAIYDAKQDEQSESRATRATKGSDKKVKDK